ncbi:MAG: aldehyde dehydrogenase [Deltaproteobacteria bacterium]|nr:aldehyde dehydrogenase [Deltaproteobacteria bacterium]
MSDEFALRLEILQQLADRLEQRRADFIAAEGEDIGTPCSAVAMEVDMAVEHLRTMALEAPLVAGKAPYGTVAAILPYDAPPVMVARVGGAAILGGNQFRFSCSSQTPRTARLFQEVVAGLPGFTAVVGMDNREFGRVCVEDPQVRVFFISGGGEVGAAYEKQAHRFDKLFFAGPSGLPPVILFKDAPLEAAVKFVVGRAFINGGQYCTTLKRAYIHREIYEPVKKMILERMPEVQVGDPRDPKTRIGPIKVERTRKLLDRALAALPEPHFLVPPRRDGEWQGPFLLETTEPPDTEMFGPFLALVPVEADTAAVDQVLRSRYPFLVAWFGTPPPGAQDALTKKFGMTYDNPEFIFTPLRLPFGGKGDSGWIIENRDGKLFKRDGAFIYSAELVR